MLRDFFFPALAAALLALAACAPKAPAGPPPPDPAYAQKPADDFQRAFAAQEGARPIKFGGWIKTLRPGDGSSPTYDSVVTVHYKGVLQDGREFDSSYERGQPATFSLRQVIPCWTFGVPMMKTGEQARLMCPGSVAYGEAGDPPRVPPNATLVFDIELLKVVK
jgi:FKBP-type peptidyl-prolyl cis-trans isomerase